MFEKNGNIIILNETDTWMKSSGVSNKMHILCGESQSELE